MELAKKNFNSNTLEKFLEICVKSLHQHALCKKKTLRGNHSPFMNKKLSKAILTRTKLRNKFRKNQTDENQKTLYAAAKLLVIGLLLLSFNNFKIEFYKNINEKDVTDNKTFWKPLKPFLSNGTVTQSKITLRDKNLSVTELKPVTEDKKIAGTLNIFLERAQEKGRTITKQ